MAPKTSPSERRSESRVVVNEPASLQSLSPLMLEALEVRVVNVSKSGMCIQLSRHIPAHSEVKLRLRTLMVFGEVVYCVPAQDGFRAGIRIKETIPPSAKIKASE